MPKDTEKACKSQDKPGPYAWKPKVALAHTLKDVLKTSAKPTVSRSHQNLILADWLTVFEFMDAHSHLSQGQVVDYFGSCINGALIFQQCTLSWKLAKCAELEDCVNSHPSALSSMCVRVVTCPDVEHALILWVQHMESKGETVTGQCFMKNANGLRTCSKFWILNAFVEMDGWPHFAKLTRSRSINSMVKLVLLTLVQWKLSKTVFKSWWRSLHLRINRTLMEQVYSPGEHTCSEKENFTDKQ